MIEELIFLVGESYLLVLPIIILYILYRRKEWALPVILSVFMTLVLVTAIKIIVVEPRPCSGLGPVLCQDPLQSFPSRHVALVAAPLVFLLSEAPVLIGYLTYVALVGLSRVYVGEHYPHDVLAGALIGIVIGYICWKIVPRLRSNNKKAGRVKGVPMKSG